MTDKQIIIDDCMHLNEWKHCDICEKLIKTKDGANGKKREHLLTVGDLKCDFYPNCYYKQLKRKEQECEELKKKCNIYTCGICGNKEDCNKLYKTLTEIKEIAEKIANYYDGDEYELMREDAEQILQKISECEGNDG